MKIEDALRELLDSTLALGGRAERFAEDTPLLGTLPELDSMAVAEVLAALEGRFNVTIDDDAVDGAIFETFGSLARFVTRLQAEQAQRVAG